MRSFVLLSFVPLLYQGSPGCASQHRRPQLPWSTGKNGRKGAKQVADILKKDTSIVGAQGGFTVFDTLKSANIPDTETAKWKPVTDWRAVCGAYAQYAKPADKKAHLVYGPPYNQTHNIWADNEWPALQQNSAVTQVFIYEMKTDGRHGQIKGRLGQVSREVQCTPRIVPRKDPIKSSFPRFSLKSLE
ncbi:hypothetical protein J3R30DRAFT_3682490 [Lentinula aciculospora]|uniref:Uncharacterized protein n=1 Tax=Lentinula aciculospora TaxID=153920 RepID=A0A9W9ABU6_9AGAR|nr:hypothetical protein J3R30DRAFT_3682490 [Lentinula aciculospora]